jgi:hypothetical protein
MVEHYICTGGCKMVMTKPGKCQSAECPMHDEPLERCDCDDNGHYGAFEDETNDDEEAE